MFEVALAAFVCGIFVGIVLWELVSNGDEDRHL